MKPILLIQGQDTYWDKLREVYNDDIIFSTWHPATWATANKFPNTLINNPPTNPGYGNSNLQFRGTEIGCRYAKKLGYDYVLKIRSDLLIPDYKKLLSLLTDVPRLSSLAYHNWSGGYLIDYIIGGPVDLLIDIYKDDTSTSSDFSERQLFDRIKSRRINKIQYLLPLMDSNNISCYSLKWERDIIQSGKTDSLYTYPEYI